MILVVLAWLAIAVGCVCAWVAVCLVLMSEGRPSSMVAGEGKPPTIPPPPSGR